MNLSALVSFLAYEKNFFFSVVVLKDPRRKANKHGCFTTELRFIEKHHWESNPGLPVYDPIQLDNTNENTVNTAIIKCYVKVAILYKLQFVQESCISCNM